MSPEISCLNYSSTPVSCQARRRSQHCRLFRDTPKSPEEALHKSVITVTVCPGLDQNVAASEHPIRSTVSPRRSTASHNLARMSAKWYGKVKPSVGKCIQREGGVQSRSFRGGVQSRSD